MEGIAIKIHSSNPGFTVSHEIYYRSVEIRAAQTSLGGDPE
jgi:hypothetical protein